MQFWKGRDIIFLIDKFASLTVGEGIFISAKEKSNIEDLINEISKQLFKNYKTVKMTIPYASSTIYNYLKENADVITEDFRDYGIEIIVELSNYLYQKYKHLLN